MDIRITHQETAAYWNEIADTYGARDVSADIEFLRAGGNYLFDAEKNLLGDLSPWCRRAIHLQCSHGNDALSLLQQGAHTVVGVDISENLLAIALRKTFELNAPATWHRSDVLDTPSELDGTADLLYTGKGALCWMMDLDAWAAVVARLLKPGGTLFLFEGHPLDWVWDTEASTYVLDAQHGDYFDETHREQLFEQETTATPHYRQWTLAQIVNAVIGAGLVLHHLEEYPELFWDQFPGIPEETARRLPHTFALLAHKPG